MNEAETRAELIDPALKAAGWGVVDASRVRREVIAPGRLEGAGKAATAGHCRLCADLPQPKLAVIEAKRRDLPDTEGVGQAKKYAEKLQARFAFSTNGRAFIRSTWRRARKLCFRMSHRRKNYGRPSSPSENAWRDRFAAVPFVEKGGDWTARYYQHNAIEKALEAIADGRQRILLTLATGTGKTAIAFQIAWKLFEAMESLAASRRAARASCFWPTATSSPIRPTTTSSLRRFPEDALARIKPDEIAQEGPRAEERQRLLHDLSDLHERRATRTANPRRISANIRPTSSIASSSTNAIAAAPTMKANGAAFSNILRRPCSSA